ncbi:BON domain-containing protein [Candidatus Nitrospira neomarina]|uniref:BON domain-containing protein n=1 Tax=Candidatus Nitrospira neomarina TaxID=3020899 RepID=A0AA96K122_9BACT|nr:BON domain-containing protein [Candidatus Nitrospira neomarina]WNM62656.1 BON domain-containing protein [Candidatus Nitrospira neomarina]
MKSTAGERMKMGAAAMALCLGMPVMAQAGSSYDYRDRSDVDTRGWSDYRAYDGDRDRHDNRQFYTDQYGDLDTMEEQDKHHRSRPEGYVTQDGYRSTASSRNTRNPNDRRADQTIRRDIMSELGEGTERVHVSVENGVATLSGMVLNREAMMEAEEAAYDGGARKVRNEMQVFRYDERPWGEMSDRSLARAVREELSWSPFVDEDPIRVNARRGVVTLQGTVKDRSQMAAAVENAYEAGARRVNNQLRIGN